MEFKNNHINGCNKKCPCRVWIQCPAYNDYEWRAWKLARKKMLPEIKEFYDFHFRDWTVDGVGMNG